MQKQNQPQQKPPGGGREREARIVNRKREARTVISQVDRGIRVLGALQVSYTVKPYVVNLGAYWVCSYCCTPKMVYVFFVGSRKQFHKTWLCLIHLNSLWKWSFFSKLLQQNIIPEQH